MNFPTSLTYWSHFVAVAMFALGLLGFLLRKNTIVVLMCIELMLNAVNLLLIETSMRTNTPDGIILVVFVVTVAAAEVAVGLGIVLNLYRLKGSVNLDHFKSLQG
ncbi:MAG: NADH-quinone oxidoreductase subunit NuoK [Deltaproteobacteria bacterium]